MRKLRSFDMIRDLTGYVTREHDSREGSLASNAVRW